GTGAAAPLALEPARSALLARNGACLELGSAEAEALLACDTGGIRKDAGLCRTHGRRPARRKGYACAASRIPDCTPPGGGTMNIRSKGFSLTELVVVIVIVTILSAFAMARINTKSFEAEGFANELAATMRYAQKTAIAQHRSVAVAITANTVALTYVGVGAVRKPPGTDAYTL